MKKVLLMTTLLTLTIATSACTNQTDNKALANENYDHAVKMWSSTNALKRKSMKAGLEEKIIADINKINKMTPFSVNETITLKSASYKDDIKTTYSEYDVEKAEILYDKNREGVINRLQAAISSNILKASKCSNLGMAIAIDMHGIEYHDIFTEKGTGEVIAKNILKTCKM